MIENNGNREVKNQHLKNIYKKYTDHIINFEKHIERIYDNWVININSRNYVLDQLDTMVRTMIRIYNNTPKVSTHNSETHNKVHKKIRQKVDIIENLEDKHNEDPFREIKMELLALSKDHGYCSMHDFFRLYLGEFYYQFMGSHTIEMFELYNKIFVPLSVALDENNECVSSKTSVSNKVCTNSKSCVGGNSDDENTTNKNTIINPTTNPNFIVNKSENGCDSLIENTCCITIQMPKIHTKIVFDGYIDADPLNIYLRTSQIYSKYLFHTKTESRNIIKNSYPQVGENFLLRYSKFANSNCYFVNNPEQMAQKISLDHNVFGKLTNKNFNLLVKDFVYGNIKNMFNMINLMLMGTEQNIRDAILLFNLLREKKMEIGEIIFHNLSYQSQSKIKKVSKIIKNEIAKIKTLSAENISLEKRLASLINMPDNVKAYILEKINEIKSGENNYKLQMAINGLVQFPWKPKDFRNDFFDIKNSLTKCRSYLLNVAKKLDETVYGHENSKKSFDRIGWKMDTKSRL